MKNKMYESKRANHKGFVISEIIFSVGCVFFLLAQFEIMFSKEYTFEPSYTVYETGVLLMRKYGLAMILGAALSAFGRILNLSKIQETEERADGVEYCELCDAPGKNLQTIKVGNDNLRVCSKCAKEQDSVIIED